MPLYEFDCDGCKKSFELLVRSTQWEGASCPHCGSTKLNKKLSVFASQTGGWQAPAPTACSRPGGCGCVGPRHRH